MKGRTRTWLNFLVSRKNNDLILLPYSNLFIYSFYILSFTQEMRDAQRITFKKVSDLTSKIQAKFQATVLSGKAINLVTVKDTEMVSKMIRMEETEFVALLAEQKVWRKAKGFVPGGGTGFVRT